MRNGDCGGGGQMQGILSRYKVINIRPEVKCVVSIVRERE